MSRDASLRDKTTKKLGITVKGDGDDFWKGLTRVELMKGLQGWLTEFCFLVFALRKFMKLLLVLCGFCIIGFKVEQLEAVSSTSTDKDYYSS